MPVMKLALEKISLYELNSTLSTKLSDLVQRASPSVPAYTALCRCQKATSPGNFLAKDILTTGSV